MSVWHRLGGLGDQIMRAAAERLQLRLPADPIPPDWPAIVDRNIPLARALDPARRDRLLHIAQLVIREVPFEGCAGLDVTEEIRVTIAATAALLLLGLPYPRFTKLVRILVYPDTFVPKVVRRPRERMEQAVVPLLGEAWIDGMVVLSWESVLRDAEHPGDGHNVILHELAHILDAEDGTMDGVPLLDDPSHGREWAHVLRDEFARQQAALDHDGDAPLHPYAATDPAEYFAVATEAFFSEPARLRERLPGLFAQLARYYRQEPAGA